MGTKNKIFVVFPYLKTYKPVKLLDITFYSSSNLEDILEDDKKHIERITSKFYLGDDFRIKNVLVAFHNNINSKEEYVTFINKIEKIQIILSYFYSIQDEVLLNSYLYNEHSFFYTFEPGIINDKFYDESHNVILPENYNPDQRINIQGYYCTLNNKLQFEQNYNSKIYAPYENFYLNIYQDLSKDIKPTYQKKFPNTVIKLLDETINLEHISKRIFTALKWYNKSNSSKIQLDDAIIYLSIALESLLGLEQGNDVKKRFKESIKLLIGDIPKLDIWLEQFYKIRSEIVHDGLFTEQDTTNNSFLSFNRPITNYAKTIFNICFTSIISGAELTSEFQLPKLFVSNSERIEEIFKILKNDKINLDLRLNEIKIYLEDINNYRFADSSVKIEQILGLNKIFISKIINNETIENKDYLELFQNFIISDSIEKKIINLGDIYNLRNKNFPVNYKNKLLENLFYLITDLSWRYILISYFQLKEKK